MGARRLLFPVDRRERAPHVHRSRARTLHAEIGEVPLRADANPERDAARAGRGLEFVHNEPGLRGVMDHCFVNVKAMIGLCAPFKSGLEVGEFATPNPVAPEVPRRTTGEGAAP